VSEHNPRLGPAAFFKHDHPPIRNVLREHMNHLSLGQRIADRVAEAIGSWPFIIVQSALLFGWIVLNVWLVVYLRMHPGAWRAWDPYPFILLNLVLSFQAAYTGPVVMMSQNREAQKDRLMAENDFQVNEKAEHEIQVVMEHLAHQDQLIIENLGHREAPPAGPSSAELAARLDEVLRLLEANDRRVQALASRLGASE
jgi:uncharacterized membrane protein